MAAAVGDSRTQFEVAQEALGVTDAARFDPAWRTSAVVALARGIEAEAAYDSVPILADGLQDSGCDDEHLLDHHRLTTRHARWWWVVESTLGGCLSLL
ncbi:hypothetical protein [Gemmata sp.]|uniref:hypothetical protein n=1 Tax=Gemmata sp. TaxID=1914242 RepID=UPI003F70D93B